jgi:hypothetical protein
VNEAPSGRFLSSKIHRYICEYIIMFHLWYAPWIRIFSGDGKCFNTEIPEKNKRSIDRGIYYIILYTGKVNIYVFVRANDNNIIWKEMILLFSIAVKGAI